MNNYLIVETDRNLIRDLNSNAIVNKNKSEYDQFLKISEQKYKEKKEFRDSKKITVQYEEQYVGINYMVITIILGLLAAIGYYVLIAVPASKERLRKELTDAISNHKKG